jgi:hypothetical protein
MAVTAVDGVGWRVASGVPYWWWRLWWWCGWFGRLVEGIEFAEEVLGHNACGGGGGRS